MTPPLIVKSDKPAEESQSGLSRVNNAIVTLMARKDPILNRVSKKSKKSKPDVSKQKKQRQEAKMIKAASKAVITFLKNVSLKEQLVEKAAKSQRRGKEIQRRRVCLLCEVIANVRLIGTR